MSGKVETLNLSDGSTLSMVRPADMSDEKWREAKDWYEQNPEEAYAAKNYSTNADQIRNQLAQDTISQYYWSKIDGGDASAEQKLTGLQDDRELKHIFDAIAANPAEAARYSANEQIMLKISKKMGGVPAEVKPLLNNLDKDPLTIYEACKQGNLKAVENFVAELPDGIDQQDFKGISALAYAVGADHLEVVKFLVGKKADASKCDGDGNSAIHYAAGYGRAAVLKYLTGLPGADVKAKNSDGKTAADMAAKNKQKAP